jgi:hypothetical protein
MRLALPTLKNGSCKAELFPDRGCQLQGRVTPKDVSESRFQFQLRKFKVFNPLSAVWGVTGVVPRGGLVRTL